MRRDERKGQEEGRAARGGGERDGREGERGREGRRKRREWKKKTRRKDIDKEGETIKKKGKERERMKRK